VTTPSVASQPAPAVEQPGPLVPRLNPKLPPDPVLLMTFEKNTVEERFGSLKAVQNLAGSSGHGESHGAIWSADGKVGGALICHNGHNHIQISQQMQNWKSEYTMFAWVKTQSGMPFRVFSEYDTDIIGRVIVDTEGRVYANTSNRGNRKFMDSKRTTEGSVSPNQWTFIALMVTNARVGDGKLRIRVNEKSFDMKLQMMAGPCSGARSFHIGHGGEECEGMIDEVGFYDRALSDAEINAIYQLGLDGENLAEMVPDSSRRSSDSVSRNPKPGAAKARVGSKAVSSKSSTPGGIPGTRGISGTRTEPPSPLVPRLNSKLPPNPVMLMTFEKNTIEERFGNMKTVQNLAGSHGHGEGRGAIWSPNGKVGGAFACDSDFIKIPRDLRNRKSEYTFFAWINPPEDVQFRVFSDYDGGILAKIAVAKEGNVFATATNIHRKNGVFFVPEPSTPLGIVPPNQWTFVALTLTDGDVDKGKLRITVNDKSYDSKLQKIQGPGTDKRSCRLGHGDSSCKGMIDEVGFYDRALSDAEINTIYQMGLDGENLAEMVPDVPAGANLWDFSEGTMVTSCSGTKSDIRNMFGGAFGNPVMLFSDGLPAGTVHFVEWKTPTPITLRSFSLRACHDGLAAGALLRGFSCFRLFAEDSDTGKFDVKLYEISPTNPYGDTPEPPYTHLDRSRGFQHLALMANIPATTAQRFRAEFVQFGPANKTVSGPRIIELEGFDTYYPDQSIPGNQKPGTAKVP
jgi:5-formyltetrahydrofolate cyclo-ligase